MEIMILCICVACCLEPSSKFLVPFALHSFPKSQAGLVVGWWYDPLFIDETKSPGAFWEQFVWRPYLEIPFWNKVLEPRGFGHRKPFLCFLQHSLHSPTKPQGLCNDENFGLRYLQERPAEEANGQKQPALGWDPGRCQARQLPVTPEGLREKETAPSAKRRRKAPGPPTLNHRMAPPPRLQAVNGKKEQNKNTLNLKLRDITVREQEKWNRFRMRCFAPLAVFSQNYLDCVRKHSKEDNMLSIYS
ncbi:uncharacterized protein [Odocoileus virginianus]|uniref:Uncharacterized protein n=1 Tax=Odocoileus virginianus TaxID=9874 RepID=A0ABM4H618_ODOVR